MAALIEVVGICETCNKGIQVPLLIAECEGKKGTKRRFCTDSCRKNRKKGRRARS